MEQSLQSRLWIVRFEPWPMSRLIGLYVALSGLLLALDVMLPRGFGQPSLYVILVVCAVWAPSSRAALLLAAWATLLTIVGHFLAPPSSLHVKVEVSLLSRAAAILLEWVTALLLVRYKTVERQLDATQARYRHTFQQTAVGFAHAALDTRCVMANDCFAEILGFASGAQLAGQRLLDLTHPDDLAAEHDVVQRLRAKAVRSCALEKRLVRVDGSSVWVNESITLARAPGDGAELGLLYVIQDISERKRAEDHLNKLKAAVESANDAVMIGTPGAPPIIEYVNGAFSRMFGYPAPEVIGRTPEIICEPGSTAVRDLLDSLGNQQSARADLSSRSATGSMFVTEWHVTSICEGGAVRYWVAIIRDMTDKHRYEEALRTSERHALRQLAELETLYHSAPIGLAMLSPDARYLKVNERLADINGVPRDAHIGKRPRDVVPGVAVRLEALVQQVLSSGQPLLDIEFEGETPKAPSTRRIWRHQLYPVTVDGMIEGVGLVVEEITEQKHDEQHLRLVMQELNHRVKNSLAVVQSMVAQTVRACSSPAEFEESLIGRIRALANTHTLLTEHNWRCADLREVVREAVRPYRRADGANVDVEGDALPLTPSASLALSMVVHELTTNAVKYGALSVQNGRVCVSWRRIEEAAGGQDDAGVRVSIETGLGPLLRLTWAEFGGPPASAPVAPGFGNQLIDFTIRHEFGGNVSMDYRSDGLVCEITIPWNRIALPQAGGASR